MDPSTPRVRYWRGSRTGTTIPFVASSAARRAEAAARELGGASVADAIALSGPSDAERVYGDAAAAAESVAGAGRGSITTLSTGGWESDDSDGNDGLAAGGGASPSGSEAGQSPDQQLESSFMSEASSDLPPLGGWDGSSSASAAASASNGASRPASLGSEQQERAQGGSNGTRSEAPEAAGPSPEWRDGLGPGDTEASAAPVRLLGEILWIARPLVYAIMVKRTGRRAWSPLLTLLAMDVASRYVTRKSVDVARGRPVRGLLHAAGDAAKAGLRQLGVLVGARHTAQPTVPVGRTATSLGAAGRFASPFSAQEAAAGHEVLAVPATALAIDPVGLLVQQVPSVGAIVSAARRFTGLVGGGGAAAARSGLSVEEEGRAAGGARVPRSRGASSGRISLLLRVVMRLSNQVRVAALAGAEGADGRGSGIPEAVHGGTLRPSELDELARRRKNLWAMYLLRSPLFGLVTRAAMLRAEGGARSVPLLGWVVAMLIAYMRQTLEWWNSVFAYSGPAV